ncbi:MAG: class I SAM-dependent methyltransferase [Planctomycetota bacterium]
MLASVATVWQLLRGAQGRTHAERLQSFYGRQAAHYDRFRERLLHGRAELIERLPITPGAHVIELGGGTARNLDFFGDRIRDAGLVEVVDLCEPLLQIARRRIGERGWDNVQVRNADATQWRSQAGLADVVYCSYSLSMIPNWFAAIDNALALLKPGGVLGVVDFYVSRRHPAPGRVRHSLFTRHFWPLWFGHDNVHLLPDLLPYLDRAGHTVAVDECRGSIPMLPLATVPYFVWTGIKRP